MVETDPRWTLVRMWIDTAGVTEGRNVLLARYDFDPTAGPGDEYALTLGIDLGTARTLPLNQPLAIGDSVHGGLPAHAMVTRLGTPLRPDSVRGTLTLTRRGLRQLTGRIDARLYFTAWDNPTVRATYELRQMIFGVK